ncbi:HTH-type transcriptional regulator GalR [Thalassocella blandensis]|nr:HTH-type transcriptional regulator GalR [Thalassocella blandensis]
MPTIKDIADAAGVSQATVSRVINNGPKVGDETRARVKALLLEMGYVPNVHARALVSKHSTSIGVVIAELADPFFATLAHGIQSVALQKNIQMLLSCGSIYLETERKAIENLLQHRCESMVVHSKALDDQSLIEFARMVPGFVLINRFIPEISHRCVWLDNVAGGELMAKHMLGLGHKSFAMVSSRYEIEDPYQRLEGVRKALADAGLELPDTHIEYSTPDQQGGEIAMQNILARTRDFTALFCYNDAMASGAMSMLFDHGIQVPKDVSLIGFDDILLAKYTRPKLTTLRYPIEVMAKRAAELALTYKEKPEAGQSPDDQEDTFKYSSIVVKRDSASTVKK